MVRLCVLSTGQVDVTNVTYHTWRTLFLTLSCFVFDRVRQRWNDTRLAWDPAQHNGITQVAFWIGDGSGPGGETSEIWTPDLELWNQQEPLADTLTSTHAIVTAEGTVFWSRPGHIKAVCRFAGLDDFPFDTLECTIEIGSWSHSGLYLRPIKLGEGFSIGGSQTAGEAYQEFSLDGVVAEEYTYPPFLNAPLEDWPVVFYHVSFKRAWQPYVRGFVVLQLMLNLFAFACFWLPPHIGERMSLSITAVLAAVASELIVAAKLPAAAELTWFAKFSMVSLLFTALALLESAAVIYFYYLTEDDLVPSFYRFLARKLRGKQEDNEKASESAEQKSTNITDETQQADEENETPSDTSEACKSRPSLRNSVVFEDQPFDPTEPASTTSDLTLDDAPMRRSMRPKGMDKELAAQFSSFRTRKSIKTIMGRDADDFKNPKEMENNAKWQKVSKKIDETSRVFFPVLFAIFLTTAFARAA
jgi:hypothetical protein